MGQNRNVLSRGAPLFAGDDLIEGIVPGSISVPGATSPRFPGGDVLDDVREYELDIPEPGNASFAIHFNAADPVHKKLRDYQENNTVVQFEWWNVGRKVNGVNTKTAITIGTVSVMSVSAQGLLVFGEVSHDEPAIGDWLEKQGDDTLEVRSADYTNPAGVRLNVKKVDGTNPSAVAATAVYTIKRRAQLTRFRGQISGLPRSGGPILIASVLVNIKGKVVDVLGTPDLP